MPGRGANRLCGRASRATNLSSNWFAIRLSKRQGPSTIYCHMTGIEAFYRECQQRGATIQGELVDREWDMKDFRLTDPSGNRLGFGEAITKERQANG